jgi:hypothetical protein
MAATYVQNKQANKQTSIKNTHDKEFFFLTNIGRETDRQTDKACPHTYRIFIECRLSSTSRQGASTAYHFQLMPAELHPLLDGGFFKVSATQQGQVLTKSSKVFSNSVWSCDYTASFQLKHHGSSMGAKG